MFQTAMLPLVLAINGKHVWVNRKPSSTHFCRPVNLQYLKETKELCQEEYKRLTNEILNLTKFKVEIEIDNVDFCEIEIEYHMDMTMFDGKCVNAVMNNKHSASCNICGAKPSEINKIMKIRQKTPLEFPPCIVG